MWDTGLGIDYAALFAATPSPYLVLTPDLIMTDFNDAFLKVTGRERDELLGRRVFDTFPVNPGDPDADGRRNLEASWRRVLATGESETMALQKYDIPVPGTEGDFEERYWSPINVPVLGSDGMVVALIHRTEDMTAFVWEHEQHQREHRHNADLRTHAESVDAELYARAKELQEANEQLRQAHAREHEVALTLQRAMLPETVPVIQGRPAAVRYLPAVESLNVCGDWYDLVDLGHGRFGVGVGDVVSQGLEAAAVMGQLRSALSAATRAIGEPAGALDALDLQARSIERAIGTTAVKVIIDTNEHTLTYSCAGHPPPMLAHPDGVVELLDQAQDTQLAARLEHVPRPQATTTFASGSILVLYTDGLIERRGEHLDTGLARLADSLTRHAHLDPDTLGDALLADLGADRAPDDIALVVIRC